MPGAERGPGRADRWARFPGAGSGLLLALIWLVFVLEWRSGALENDASLLRLGALPEGGALHGQYWRLLSFGLLHWDLVHIVLNAVCILIFGPVVERRIGRWRLLALFASASVLSGLAILLKHELLPAAGVAVGASGGMFGLMGAALVLVERIPPARSRRRRWLWLTSGGAFVYSLLPGISMAGHVAGFLAGALIGTVVQARAPE